MEKIENRNNYIKEYHQFVSLVKLTPEFVTALEQHQYFKSRMDYVKDLPEAHKLSFILLELTRERSTCQAVINLLNTCGQTEAARRLSNFNRSSGPMPLVFDETLEVNYSVAPKKDLSNTYNLTKNKRGKWIIVNNVEEPQTPTVTRNGKEYETRGLDRETKRFKDLFEKLHFEVQVITRLSAQELKQRLQYISEDMSLERDEAFGLMVITHGEDEKIYGYKACDTMAKMKHKQISSDDPVAQEVIRRDLIDIKEIIAIFSDANCPQLRGKPKLFFFTCCRVINSPNSSGGLGNKASVSPGQELIKVTKQKSTMDTFVAYSCSQGSESFFDPFNGYSYFGQALSHSIAQYACEESLSDIMSRTQTRLTEIYNGNELIPNQMGSFAIEMDLYAMNRQLYFNPGIYEKEDKVVEMENVNTSKTQLGLVDKVLDETLEVKNSVAPKKDVSNNLEEPQTPTFTKNDKEDEARGLDRETKRFKVLFEKLHFEVLVISRLSAQELKQRLQYISEDMSLERDEAFGLMVITHGEDEKINAYNACDTMAKIKHKQISSDDPEAQEVIRRDLIDIKEIIAIFSDVNGLYNELVNYAMTNQLYFNPGIYDKGENAEENVDCIEKENTIKTQLGHVDKVNDYRGTYALKVLNPNQLTSKFAENSTLMKKIGSGGQGKVYETEDNKALKKILKDMIHYGLTGKNYEIQLMRELKSEYVVQLYDYWEKDDAVFIKMELCDANLDNIIDLKERFFSLSPMMDYIFSSLIFIDVLECVDYLHSRSPPVIHRDLKPSNFLVKNVPTNNRFIKLTDFGISILNKINERTRFTKGIGTYNYQAPELFDSSILLYTEKVDIFSLGTLAYKLFSSVKKDINMCARNEYKEIYQIRQLMKGEDPLMRPYCQDILESRAKWTIGRDEIRDNYVLCKFPDTINSEEYQFIKIFLESKLGPIPNTV